MRRERRGDGNGPRQREAAHLGLGSPEFVHVLPHTNESMQLSLPVLSLTTRKNKVCFLLALCDKGLRERERERERERGKERGERGRTL